MVDNRQQHDLPEPRSELSAVKIQGSKDSVHSRSRPLSLLHYIVNLSTAEKVDAWRSSSKKNSQNILDVALFVNWIGRLPQSRWNHVVYGSG